MSYFAQKQGKAIVIVFSMQNKFYGLSFAGDAVPGADLCDYVCVQDLNYFRKHYYGEVQRIVTIGTFVDTSDDMEWSIKELLICYFECSFKFHSLKTFSTHVIMLGRERRTRQLY